MRYVLVVTAIVTSVALGQELPTDTTNLKTLTVDQAKAVVPQPPLGGLYSEGGLELDAMTTLSGEVAQSLAQHEAMLSLNGLTTLSDKAADALSQHKGTLHLYGLTTLSKEAAAALRENRAVDLPAGFKH